MSKAISTQYGTIEDTAVYYRGVDNAICGEAFEDVLKNYNTIEDICAYPIFRAVNRYCREAK